MEKTRIMLAGPSGVGKTTLAKSISEHLGIPFISGSFRDAVPSTKNIHHRDMIQKADLATEIKAVKNRLEMYSKYESYVTDRSFLDNMAYGIHKLSHLTTTCEMNDLLKYCSTLLLKNCDILIFVPYDYVTMSGVWQIPNDGKRVTNAWFQDLMTTIFKRVMRVSFSKYGGMVMSGDNKVNYASSSVLQRNPQIDHDGKCVGDNFKLLELEPNSLRMGFKPEDMDWFPSLIEYIGREAWLRNQRG